ncbi:MAG TPA: nitroreductase family protein [Leptolyngbya sp.]|jgi:nitroreductase|nr:nitroreductase family protein [Leptolyngbya sp.]
MTISTDRTTTPLDVPTAILQRRAIKSFKPDAIAPELLHQLVELTVAAPSSYNVQDWKIILVQDPEQKQALAAAAFNQQQIIQAPVTFVFAAVPEAAEGDLTPIFNEALDRGAWTQQTVDYFETAIPGFQQQLGDKRREYAIKDAMIAATHTALAAESLGLSSCYMNGWAEDQVKAVIGAADDLAIALLLSIGYAAESRKNPGRLPLSANVFVDRIGNRYQ